MKKFLACLLLAALMIGTTACQKGSFGDTYIEGQDQQYMYTDLFYGAQEMTETEEGYYFLYQNYLFFADRETLEVSPLCDNPGCLHEKETDTSKTWKCNAYYFTGIDNFIASWGDSLYIKVESNQMGKRLPKGGLMQVSKDGMEKSIVCEFQELPGSSNALHRGKFYYASKEVDRKLSANYNIHEVDLQNGGSDRILYNGKKESGCIPQLLCYGNHLYFKESYVKDENSYVDVKEINLQTGEITELKPEGEEEAFSLRGVFHDRIYYTSTNSYETGQWDWKYMNLDQSNRQEWFSTPEEQLLYADTRYFYLYTPWVYLADSEKEPSISMLDKDGNQIGNCDLSAIEGDLIDFMPGGEQYFFLISIDDDYLHHYYAVNKEETAKTGQGKPKEFFQPGDIVSSVSDLPL